MNEAVYDEDIAYPHLLAPGAARAFLPIIQPVIDDLGYELIRIRLTGAAVSVVQLMAEKPDGTMSVEDCAALSRVLSTIFDVENPIKDEYVLEVSSPGMARPLSRVKDFAHWVGHEAKLELMVSMGGQKRFRGVLAGFKQGKVYLQIGQASQILGFYLDDIAHARLIVDEQALAGDLKEAKTKKKARR